MYKTVLLEEITIENVTEKINEKVKEMEQAWVSFLNLSASITTKHIKQEI